MCISSRKGAINSVSKATINPRRDSEEGEEDEEEPEGEEVVVGEMRAVTHVLVRPCPYFFNRELNQAIVPKVIVTVNCLLLLKSVKAKTTSQLSFSLLLCPSPHTFDFNNSTCITFFDILERIQQSRGEEREGNESTRAEVMREGGVRILLRALV